MSSINCFKSHFRGKWWNSRFSCAFSHFVVIEYILMGHSINYSTMLKSFGQSGEFNWFSLVLSCLSRKLCKNLVCSYFEGKSIHHWYQWEIDKKRENTRWRVNNLERIERKVWVTITIVLNSYFFSSFTRWQTFSKWKYRYRIESKIECKWNSNRPVISSSM